MAYTIRPAIVEDAPVITEIFLASFNDNHIMKYFYKDTPREIEWDHYLKYYVEKIQESLYGRRYTVMVDDSTGKAVAFSAWQYPHHLTSEQTAERDMKVEEAKKTPPLQGAQVELIDEWFEQLLGGRKKFIDPQKTFCKSLDHFHIFSCCSIDPTQSCIFWQSSRNTRAKGWVENFYGQAWKMQTRQERRHTSRLRERDYRSI